VKGGVKKASSSLSDFFSGKETYTRPSYEQPKGPTLISQAQKKQDYDIPPVISEENKPVFIEQAKLAGVTPTEFGQIARREQGAGTLPHQAAMVGGADPTDKGVMQVNEMHNAIIKKRFEEEIGRQYNPFNTEDSIIAARMVLEENRRQLEQMKINKSFQGEYSGNDLVDMYNTGVRGWVEAKEGNEDRIERLSRYQNAGQI